MTTALPQSAIVIDTDDLIKTVVKSYLAGFEVTDVEAFKFWRDAQSIFLGTNDKTISLLILDLRAKSPSAAEIIASLRRNPRYKLLPILLMSQQITKDDIALIKENPKCTHVVVKPFTEDMFLTAASKFFPDLHPKKRKKKSKMSIIQGGQSDSSTEGAPSMEATNSSPVSEGLLHLKGTPGVRGNPSDIFSSENPEHGQPILQQGQAKSDLGLMTEKGNVLHLGSSEVQRGNGEKLGNLIDQGALVKNTNFVDENPKKNNAADFQQQKNIDKDWSILQKKDALESLRGSMQNSPIKKLSDADEFNAGKLANGSDLNFKKEFAPAPHEIAASPQASKQEISRPTKAPEDVLDISEPPANKNLLTNTLGLNLALVVDGDDSNRNLMVKYLRDSGIPNVGAEKNGKDAWEYLKTKNPNFIILDWKISEVSGLAIYNRIRKDKRLRETPVIVVCGFVKKQDFRILEESSKTIFIEKPFQASIFDKKLFQFVSHIRHQDRNIEVIKKFILDNTQIGKNFMPALLNSFSKSSPPASMFTHVTDFLLGLKRYDDAEKILNLGLNLHKNNVMLLGCLGKLFHKTNRPKEAFQILSKAEGLSPENIERLCLLGEVGLSLHAPEKAREYFNKVLTIDQDDVIAKAGNVVSQNLNEYMAEKSEEPDSLNKTLSSMLNIVAITLIRNNQHLKGVEQYQAAMSFIDEPHVLARLQFNLGLAYLRSKDLNSAKSWFEEATKNSDGNFPKAAAYLAKTAEILKNKGSFVETTKLYLLEEEMAIMQSDESRSA